MASPLSFLLLSPAPAPGCDSKAIPESWAKYVTNSEIQCLGLYSTIKIPLTKDLYKEIAQVSKLPLFNVGPASLPDSNGYINFEITFASILPDIQSDASQTTLCLMCIINPIDMSIKSGEPPIYKNVVCINVGYTTQQYSNYKPSSLINDIILYIYSIKVQIEKGYKLNNVYCQYDNTIPPFPPEFISSDIKPLVDNTSEGGPNLDKNMVTTPRGTVVSVSIGNPHNS